VVSGHAEEAYRPILEGLPPNAATIVVMMGLGRADQIADVLMRRGWKPTTPAAVLLGMSTPESEVWTATLDQMRRGLNIATESRPGTIVIGDVVKLRAALVPEVEAGIAAVR
jgi:siroheme synthase